MNHFKSRTLYIPHMRSSRISSSPHNSRQDQFSTSHSITTHRINQSSLWISTVNLKACVILHPHSLVTSYWMWTGLTWVSYEAAQLFLIMMIMMNTAPDTKQPSTAFPRVQWGFICHTLVPRLLRLLCNVVFVLSLAHSGCSVRSGLRKRRRGTCEGCVSERQALSAIRSAAETRHSQAGRETTARMRNPVTQYRLNRDMEAETHRTQQQTTSTVSWEKRWLWRNSHESVSCFSEQTELTI